MRTLIVITRTIYGLRIAEIWFAPGPFDIRGYDKVIFEACTINTNLKGFQRRLIPTNVIDLTLPLGKIWEGFDKKSTRYAINAAMRSDSLVIKTDSNYEEFLKLSKKFTLAKNLPSISIEDLKSGKLFTAWENGKLVVGHYYLCNPPVIRLRYSVSTLPLAPNYRRIGNISKYLHWEAIKFAKTSDFQEFDFGGLDLNKQSPLYGISRFKLSFGGRIIIKFAYVREPFAIRATRRIWYLLHAGNKGEVNNVNRLARVPRIYISITGNLRKILA